jgi:hypothetical protein
MPLSLPNLDDRTFEQLLAEAQRRIPGHTREWTNYAIESDPGLTIIQLFAFLTDSLIYRANRIPELNRRKFVQLLGVPMRPASAAEGLVVIHNERGPVEAVTLDRGVIVSAGNVDFLTRDGVTVLPVEAQVYYKRKIAETDPEYDTFKTRYEALLAAMTGPGAAATGEPESPPALSSPPDDGEEGGPGARLDFYETTPAPAPTPSTPAPVVDLVTEAVDRAIYIALLAPKNVAVDDVREAIAHKTLSIGIVPALADPVAPLAAHRSLVTREPLAGFAYEVADPAAGAATARYLRLSVVQEPDVLDTVGIVQVELPGPDGLGRWEFSEPMQEGTGDFPPKLEDEKIAERLVTWIRLRLPTDQKTASLKARLTWIGINAARITQAIRVVNEPLGEGNGEPDQMVTLASTPVIEGSTRLEIQAADGSWQAWRFTDDLLSAGPDEQVFTIDPESGQVRFGDGLRGARPPAGRRIRASYEYGAGRQGNVGIAAVKTTGEARLQGGFRLENPLPTWGGDDGETIAQAEANIPLYLRHRDRLVTERDFGDITRRAPGVDVGRVDVLSLFHPALPPQQSAAGVVTLMVIPALDPLRPRWPSPDRLFLRKICDYLEPRRLMTTELHVRGPQYVPVHLSVGVRVRAGHVRDVVLQAVRTTLPDYLSALPPGGPDGEGWPLGKRLMKKDLEAVVTRVAGVEFVESLELGVRGSQDVEQASLTGLELPFLAQLAVREGEAEPLAAIGAPSAEPPTTIPVPVSRVKC